MLTGIPYFIQICLLNVSLLLFTIMDFKVAPLGEKVIAGMKETSVLNSIEVVEAQAFDEKASKKLVRKLDWHLIPFLSLIYL